MINTQINGILLSQMGVALLSGSYSELMKPASLKSFIENDDPAKDGIEIDILSFPKQQSRDLTLKFLVYGDTRELFLSRRKTFLDLLYSGIVTLYVPELGESYRLLYKSVTQYGNYRTNACEMAVKFKEPDPTNRTP